MRLADRARPWLATALLALTVGCGGEGVGPLPADWHRGANFTAYGPQELARSESDRALEALRATGATHVAIVPTWYQDGARSSVVARDPSRSPSEASVLHAMRHARAIGLRVTLKPHVDLSDGGQRRAIRAASAAAWLASYRRYLYRYADLARRGGAELFVVGTELDGMTAGHPAAWRRLIAGVRERFPGALTYAGGVDRDGRQHVSFWDALDYIGLNAYWPLARPGEKDPSAERLVSAWRTFSEDGGTYRYLDVARRLHARYRRPVLLTELGYASSEGTAAEPWRNGGTGRVSPTAQQRAYDAAYRVWSKERYVKGIYWWDWSATGAQGARGDDHSPRGKPAEETMRRWNGIGRSDRGLPSQR